VAEVVTTDKLEQMVALVAVAVQQVKLVQYLQVELVHQGKEPMVLLVD
jgi:hypothetical protein